MGSAASTLGWLVATGAAAAAGFFAARALEPAPLPEVATEPPAFEMALARLAEERDAELARLRAQLEAEGRIRSREIADLAARLGALEAPTEPKAAPAEAEEPSTAEPAPPAPRRATVGASSLWVRAGPGAEHDRVGRLARGAAVELAGAEQAGWVQLSEPLPGWVAAEFLTPGTD